MMHEGMNVDQPSGWTMRTFYVVGILSCREVDIYTGKIFFCHMFATQETGAIYPSLFTHIPLFYFHKFVENKR